MWLFQSKQPLIHILYIRMKKLVGDSLSKFYSIKFLSNIVDSHGLLKISELIKFDVYAKKKYNAQREMGSKTKRTACKHWQCTKEKSLKKDQSHPFI